jgi:hypothetical protein
MEATPCEQSGQREDEAMFKVLNVDTLYNILLIPK